MPASKIICDNKSLCVGPFHPYALHPTRLQRSATFAALYLLQHLEVRSPASKGSSGHQLFILAFMLASKIICNDTYSNKSWCIVGQGMFALQEINQMVREICSYLEWQLNVDPSTSKVAFATTSLQVPAIPFPHSPLASLLKDAPIIPSPPIASNTSRCARAWTHQGCFIATHQYQHLQNRRLSLPQPICVRDVGCW